MTAVRLSIAGALFFALALACGSARDFSVGSDCDGGFCSELPPPPAPSSPPDAEPDAATHRMCPTSECRAPFTTCSSSNYRCDVDLTKDNANCGACGNQCLYLPNIFVREACVEGACVPRCDDQHADCDGIIDNGCESDLRTNDHCGSCGNVCGETAPCAEQIPVSFVPWACGCPAPLTQCDGICVNLQNDYGNCGRCGLVCERPADLPPEYGFKCVFGVCKVVVPVTDLCPSGDPPKLDFGTGRELCECPPGLVDCSTEPDHFDCVDFASDKRHCGGCGRNCADAPNGIGACLDGRCELLCAGGNYDCNGFMEDGCEVNIQSDPRNCGGCGNACDVAIGQPCVDGVCSIAPCEVAR